MFLTSLALPSCVWSWRGSLGVGLLLVAPVAAVLGLAHGPDLADTLSTARTIALCFAALVAASLIYAHGRIAANEQSEWLGVALAVPAALSLARTGHALTHPDDLPDHAGDVLLLSTVVTGVAALLVAAALRRPAGLRPLGAALPPLLVALGVQQFLLTSSPWFDLDATTAVAVAHVAVSVALAALVLRLEALPEWARRRLAGATVLGSASTALGAVVPGDLLVTAVCLAGGLAAALFGLTTAVSLLRSVVDREQHELSSLHARLAATEAARRADRTRLHEVNTIVAGISSAAQLVEELPRDQADELRGQMGAELGRLQRLLEHRGEVPLGSSQTRGVEVDLDEVIGPIAATHRARGHQVSAPSSGVRALGDPDDIAQILNILVDNAAQHGSPDDITVLVEELPDAVEVHVSDRGPGIAPALRPTLFDWEQRRGGSPGEGIGLYAATRIARRLGADLRLEGTTSGASFVLHLPGRPERTQVRDRLSHAR